MLTETFSIFNKVGPATEQSLWSAGILTWDDLLREVDKAPIGTAQPEQLRLEIEEWKSALETQNNKFLSARLGLTDSWRAFPNFRDSVIYLDIETDGGQSASSITVIGVYDGEVYTALVQGEDLTVLPELLQGKKYLVTFYGSGFDVPMIKKAFPQLDVDLIHLDLCVAFRQAGIHGGLKKIEKYFGLSRSDETTGLNGYDAVRLWQRFDRQGDQKALKTLIEYNREDVVNMEFLAEKAYEKLRQQALLNAIGA